MIKGISITLYQRTQSGADDFNRPTYTETAVTVENVLIAPATEGGQELTEQLNLRGRKAVYTLAIPKGDTNSWENCRVDFFGQSFRVIGIPTEGIDELIPLRWNRKVQVEKIE